MHVICRDGFAERARAQAVGMNDKLLRWLFGYALRCLNRSEAWLVFVS